MDRTVVAVGLVSAAALVMSAAALLSGPSELSPPPSVGVDPIEDADEYVPPSDRPDDRSVDPTRLAQIERRLTKIELRLTAMEARRPGSQSGSDEPLGDNPAEIEASILAESLQTEEGREALKDVFRDVQREVFTERFQAWRAEREKAQDDRLKKLSEDAALTLHQQESIKALINSERETIRATFESMRPGPGGFGRRNIRETIRNARAKTDDSVRTLLSEEQYSKYEAMREEDRFRGHGGRGDERGREERRPETPASP